jgi:large subunit ribosomal protein L9
LKGIADKIAAMEAAAAAEKAEAKQKEAALARTFGDKGCFIEKNVAADGSIFGSVTPTELAEIIAKQAGITVDKKIISSPTIKTEDAGTIPPQKVGGTSIKIAGTGIADIKLHPEVVSKLKVVIVPK